MLNSVPAVKNRVIYVIAALFIAGADVKLFPTDPILGLLWEQAGISAVFADTAVRSILPPCPFISYPVIRSFNDGGVAIPATMMMLITATIVEVGKLFCGLIFLALQSLGCGYYLHFLQR